MPKDLNGSYWDNRYQQQDAVWDIGFISTPLKAYIDQLPDKNVRILVPGCGNAYEAEYLLQQGFKHITLVDIAPELVNSISKKFQSNIGKELTVILGDFFELDQQFDLIIEQTFFCALNPALRNAYAEKLYEILNPEGKLAGVLFNKHFEEGPPFGGSKEEYEKLFSEKFAIRQLAECYNSIAPRKDAELFIILKKEL